MPADTHEQRIGNMSPTQAFSAHPRPVTSVLATKVSPWLPATLIGVSLAETAETLAPIPRHWCPKIPGADVASPPFPHASSARIILQARLMHRLALAEYN